MSRATGDYTPTPSADTLTRRSLIAGAAAALPATALAAIPSPMTAIGRQFEMRYARFLAARASFEGAKRRCHDLLDLARDNAAREAAWITSGLSAMEADLETEKLFVLTDDIVKAPAPTLADLALKARAAAFSFIEIWDEPINDLDWEYRIIRELCEAVCALAGAPAPNVARGATVAASAVQS